MLLSKGFKANKSVLNPIFSAWAIDSSVVPDVEHSFLNLKNFYCLIKFR